MFAQGFELVGLAGAAQQGVGAAGAGGVQGDACEAAIQSRLFGVFTQFGGTCSGATQAQEGDFVDAVEQGVEAAEVAEQGGGGLGADAGYAGDVVHAVAAQGQVVGDLVRVHAEFFVHAGGPPAQAAGVVPLLVVLAQQLAEILVGGDDHAAPALRAQVPHGAADQVVGLEAVVDHQVHAERFGDRAALHELPLQVGRRQLAVGLVRRVDRVAERAGQRGIERHRDVFGLHAFEQFAQETGVAVHRVDRVAVGVEELVRHRVPGAEDIHAAVDKMDGWTSVRRRVHGAHVPSRSASAGRSRSGTSICGVPRWTKPTTCSCSARPRMPATSRSYAAQPVSHCPP